MECLSWLEAQKNSKVNEQGWELSSHFLSLNLVDIVQMVGSIPGATRGLVAVCSCLQDYPSSEKPKTAGNRIEAASSPNPDMQLHSQRRPAIPPTPSNSAGYVSVTHHLSTEIDRLPSLSTQAEQNEVVFRILCSNERVGGVIGRGGTIVRALRNETGASIRCAAPVSEVNERLITIAALENAESQFSPAQNATLLVFKRSVEVGIARGIDSVLGSTVTARILVPSGQVSCLLSRGGEIISGMRRTSGAAINIFASDQVPKGAPENSQIVQISGEFVSVQDALYKVTSRLRASLFPNQIVNDVGTLSDASSEPEVSPCGHRDSASLGMDKSVGVINNLSQHTALIRRMDNLGLSQQLDLPPPPNLGVSQTGGGLESRHPFDIGKGLASINGGLELGSGSKSAIVTNITLEIVVPKNVLSSTDGENGSNLACLRQISGAKVMVHEPLPGANENIIVISGTPDETQAAQSLLQAFILDGSSV
ncbi:K Homology domain, type 1 [Dillenia turbinata]|uniref:K Homology domain, type 1 n=1 Tax=Dillenia turbinata TaxID=194707 RepID=A0AAN8ZQF1_9MAGN